MPEIGAAVLRERYFWNSIRQTAPASTAFGAAGRVILAPISVPWPVIVDRLLYSVGAAANGNVRMCIYREGSTPDSPQGGGLVVETASVAQSGINQLEMLPIPNTLLLPGQYFLGLQTDDVTATIWRTLDQVSDVSWYYDLAGGYGPFADPCPAVASMTWLANTGVRIAQNLPPGRLRT